MNFYRPGFPRTQMQFHLDNERVPGNFMLMLEDPSPERQLPWNDAGPFSQQPEIDKVFRFDLTDSDAIVIGD